MSPPPNGQPQQSMLQRVADFFRTQLASIQQNVSLTRNTLMSQRTGGVGTILSNVPARVAGLGILPILRQPTPGAPAGPTPTEVTPTVEVTVIPGQTGDISQEFQPI